MESDELMELIEDGDEFAVRDGDEVIGIVLPGDALGGADEVDLLVAEGDEPGELDF